MAQNPVRSVSREGDSCNDPTLHGNEEVLKTVGDSCFISHITVMILTWHRGGIMLNCFSGKAFLFLFPVDMGASKHISPITGEVVKCGGRARI